ncbi:hypothetical protein J6590_045767 [Homalodisca vitripennis]|nr:hypothetical protein J6590_045767 [Homalodisca vitripennis]
MLCSSADSECTRHKQSVSSMERRRERAANCVNLGRDDVGRCHQIIQSDVAATPARYLDASFVRNDLATKMARRVRKRSLRKDAERAFFTKKGNSTWCNPASQKEFWCHLKAFERESA